MFKKFLLLARVFGEAERDLTTSFAARLECSILMLDRLQTAVNEGRQVEDQDGITRRTGEVLDELATKLSTAMRQEILKLAIRYR